VVQHVHLIRQELGATPGSKPLPADSTSRKRAHLVLLLALRLVQHQDVKALPQAAPQSERIQRAHLRHHGPAQLDRVDVGAMQSVVTSINRPKHLRAGLTPAFSTATQINNARFPLARAVILRQGWACSKAMRMRGPPTISSRPSALRSAACELTGEAAAETHTGSGPPRRPSRSR